MFKAVTENSIVNDWEHLSYEGFNHISYIDSQNIILADYGRIFSTNDGGKVWKLSTIPIDGFECEELCFIDTQKGFVGGAINGNPVILKTTNGGQNWIISYQGENQDYQKVRDIHFVNDNVGFARSDYRLLKTTNGGDTWSVLTNFAKYTHGFSYVDENNLFVSASSNTLYISNNGGATWNTIIVPTSDFQLDVVFFESPTIGWVATYKGNLFKTTDGGNSWALKHSSSSSLDFTKGIEKINQSVYYMLGEKIAKSIDGGETWEELSTPSYSSLAEYYIDESNFILLPRFEQLYKYHGNILGGNGYQITQPTLSINNLCAGEEIAVSFDVTDSGNYYVELSDENGNFNSENPNIIGQTNGIGNISFTASLPTNSTTSTNYKVQVYLSSPTTSYSQASNTFTIQGTISPSIDNLPSQVQDIDDDIILTGSPLGGTFQVNGANATIFDPSILGIGTHTVDYTVSSNGCDATVTQYATVSAGQSVAINTAISSICAGNTLALTLDMQGTFNDSDIYSVQLSDASGSFDTSTDLAIIVGQQSGALTVSIPSFIPSGNDYKIRMFGNNNSSNEVGPITIQSAPNPAISIEEPTYNLADEDTITLAVNHIGGGSNPSINWYKNNELFASNTETIDVVAPNIGDVFYASMTSNENCSNGEEVVSIPLFIEECQNNCPPSVLENNCNPCVICGNLNDLFAYYAFNGDANDESGNGYHGILNGPTLTTDRLGNPNSAYNFDGINDKIIISNPFGNSVSENTYLSISVWFKTSSNKTSSTILSSHTACSGGTQDDLVSINFNGGSQEKLSVSVMGLPALQYFSEDLNDGTWHHVVLSYANDSSQLYLDGVKVVEQTGNANINFNPNIDLIIGDYYTNACGTDAHFDGEIDDIRLFNKSLTSVEVAELFNENDAEYAPVANFTSTSNDLVVNFIDLSENSQTISWQFGNGATSTEPNPQYTYPSPGTYTVIQTVSSSCGIDTKEVSITVEGTATGVSISNLKVFLEGPYDAVTQNMRTDLADGNHLPNSSLISSAILPQVVDWMEIELRSDTDSTLVIDNLQAVLLSDGSIVDTAGNTSIEFSNVLAGNYYVVLKHRNHLDVMTALPVSLEANTITLLDFTDTTLEVFGGSLALKDIGGKRTMYAGDASNNEQISPSDANNFWFPQSGLSGYHSADFNFDSQVSVTDKNFLWLINSGLGSQVPPASE